MPSQTENQRQNWQTSKARSTWAESLLRRAQNQITIESDAVAKIQTAMNAAQTEVAAILADIQANQAPEWRVRRAQQQLAALERLDGELRSKLLTIARAAAEEVKILSKGMPQQQADKINTEVSKAASKLSRSTDSARPEIGRSTNQGRGLVAIDARSVDIAVSFVPDLIVDQVGALKKAVKAEILRNSLALSTPAESIARLTSVATPIGAFPTAAVRAEAIVRTEFGRVSNIAAMSGIQALAANPYGLSTDQRSYMLDANGVMYKEWIAVGDHRTRPEHAALDGTIIPINESFMVGEFSAQFPKDPSLPAKHAVNCRCMVVPSFPPEIADRLGAMPDAGDGSFGEMLAMMQQGEMVGTATGGGGGEAFSYAPEVPPNGFDYDIGYDPSDAAVDTFFVNQDATTPALSGAADPTAPPQPITVSRGVSPLNVIAGIQQSFGLIGNVRTRQRPSSLISFIRFATKILNTAERNALLKPLPSVATHQPRLSVDAAEFQNWLAEQRGELNRKKPLKNKKKVLIDPDEVEKTVLPTPLIVATDESIGDLSADQLSELVGSDRKNQENQREYWNRVLGTDEGGFGFGANKDITPPWANGRLQFDRKKWDALPKVVRESIVRGILMAEGKKIGANTAELISGGGRRGSEGIIGDLGSALASRALLLKEKGGWDGSSALLKGLLDIVSDDAQGYGIGRTPSDQTITIPIGTPDQNQGFGYGDDNPIHPYLYKTSFAFIGKYIPVQDLTLRVADLHREVVLNIRVPSDPEERALFFKDMREMGNVDMSKVDIAAGTLTLGVSGYDFVMNYFVPDTRLTTTVAGSIPLGTVGDIFTLPVAGRTETSQDSINTSVWYTNEDGQLVFDLSQYIGNEEARALILKHNADTGESIIDAGRGADLVDLVDASGKRIFQMHDLVDPPAPQSIIPADGKIVGVDNIFNFLHNKTGVYDVNLTKTHYALGGWRLARETEVPVLVLPPAINSRDVAVPFLSHLEKLLGYYQKSGAFNPAKLLPFNKRIGTYKPKDNFYLNIFGELIEDGSLRTPNAEGADPVVLWETPPASIADADAILPQLILIANKKRRGEQLTDEERATYETATNRYGDSNRKFEDIVDWASGFSDVDSTIRNSVETVALRRKLKTLGLDVNEDFALWRAEKLKNTVFGEVAERIIAANPQLPRLLILRRLFGVHGLTGGGVKDAQYTGFGGKLDPFAESNGADALDLMQFAQERGITPEQVLGEQRVAMLRKLYDADLLTVLVSSRTSLNGMRDGLGSGMASIALEDSGVAVSAAKKLTLLVPAPLGEDGVTYEQLNQRTVVEIPATVDYYDANAPMGAGEILLQDTSLPFRAINEVAMQGDAGFTQILRLAVGNQLLGLANAGLFRTLSFRSDARQSPRVSGRLRVTEDQSATELPSFSALSLAKELQSSAKKSALLLADGVARDALNDPLQFEDVLRAVARAAVERGASESDPLIAALLAIPRLQDGSEVVASPFWENKRDFDGATLRMKENPALAGNPHYAKILDTLSATNRRYATRPIDFVDLSALAETIIPMPEQPPTTASPEAMGVFYKERSLAVDARVDLVNRMVQDPSFILRAILSRAYTTDQQRQLMGSLAPFKGQMLKKDASWTTKPVDVSWYELEATLLEIIADEAAKNMPAGASDGTVLSEDAFGTVKMTPELWEATQLLDAYEWDTRLSPDAKAAYDLILAATKDHSEQRQAIIRARIAPIVEALGYQRGTPEFEGILDVYVAHAQGELPTGTILGGDYQADVFIPAVLASINSKLVKFGRRGMSDIPADGAGMAIASKWRKYGRLRNPEADYDEAAPYTPQKLRLVAKAVRDHLVNLQLERQSLARKQIVDALNQNNAELIGGRMKAAEWAAKARKLIRAKRSAIEAEKQRLRILAKGKPIKPVSDELYEETLSLLDKDLEAALKAIPKNKFLGVTDAKLQSEIEQYRDRIDGIMKGVEQTIMGVTTTELVAPNNPKSLGSGSINKPWRGEWDGHKFIIKSLSSMYASDPRSRWGIGKYADLWSERAAQVVDELGGLFIRKAQAYLRELPDIRAGSETLGENTALVMDWLEGFPSGHSSQRNRDPQTADNFDLMSVFEALIGNTDRHGGNYLIAPIPTATQPAFDSDGYPIDPVTRQRTGALWEKYNIVPIDNGLAFPNPEVHLDYAGGNESPFMTSQSGVALTPRAREVLLRLWSNRSELYVRLTTLAGASKTRGFFYRMIWMLRSGEFMGWDTLAGAEYNPLSPNADATIRGAFDEGQSLLDANITSPIIGVREDPNRIEGQIPALPLSGEPQN